MMHPCFQRLTRSRVRRGAACVVAALLSLLPWAGQAAECGITVNTDDAIRFTPAHIVVPSSCKDFTVTLTETGHLPALAMSHNWVLTKKSDLDGVARTGMVAGAQAQFIDRTDKRVLAYTKLIGAGETTTVTLTVAQLIIGETYAFLCTFAGHSPIMRGTLIVE